MKITCFTNRWLAQVASWLKRRHIPIVEMYRQFSLIFWEKMEWSEGEKLQCSLPEIIPGFGWLVLASLAQSQSCNQMILLDPGGAFGDYNPVIVRGCHSGGRVSSVKDNLSESLISVEPEQWRLLYQAADPWCLWNAVSSALSGRSPGRISRMNSFQAVTDPLFAMIQLWVKQVASLRKRRILVEW